MDVFLRSKAVKKRLIRKNKSQNWLAYKAKISSGYMSQLLDGSRHPSPNLRERLLNIFKGCEFDDLFFVKEE